jgi:nicotinamidase-related amidase
MTSAPVRDPLSDHLITPDNAALLLIDYQPAQLAGVRSMDRDLLVKNAVSTVKTIKTFEVPVVTRPSTSPPAGDSQPSPNSPTCSKDDKPQSKETP